MRKIFYLFLLVFCFFGCDFSNKSEKEEAIIDLRNKDANGDIFRSVKSEQSSGEALDFVIKNFNYDYGHFTEAQTDNFLKLYDNDKGVKLVFTIPFNLTEDVIYARLTRLQLIYVDENGFPTTSQCNINIDALDINETAEGVQYSWVFPLLRANKSSKLIVQTDYFTQDKNDKLTFLEYQKEYSFVPKHGLGCVDDLPIDYDPSNHIFVDGRKIYLNKVIPVEAEPLFKQIEIWDIDENVDINDYDWNGWNTLIRTEIHTNEDSLFEILPDNLTFTRSHVFFQYTFTYKIDGFDWCDFSSLGFRTEKTPVNLIYSQTE